LADRIELAEILAEPTKYLMVFRPSMVEFDFQGYLPSRCRCLYGYWPGYLSKSDWVELQERIAQAEGNFIPAHVSGHAYVADIIRFVNSVNARTVIPIHTFEPQMYQAHFPNVTMMSDGMSLDLCE
jgi:ribonuclease J